MCSLGAIMQDDTNVVDAGGLDYYLAFPAATS